MTDQRPDNARLLMQAALDGELDAAGQLAVEWMLAEDPRLAAEQGRVAALQRAMRETVGRDRAPDALRAHVAALSAPPRPPNRLPERPSWIALAAAMVVAAGLAGLMTSFAVDRRPPPTAETIVADHMRSLLAAEPVDVASSDRHTVKPWFDKRLAASPMVPELADKGFPLVGGRVDVVRGEPVPTLVYRSQTHLISLTALPRDHALPDGAPASLRGYRLIAWRDADFTYWVVSDIGAEALDAFAVAFRGAAGGS